MVTSAPGKVAHPFNKLGNSVDDTVRSLKLHAASVQVAFRPEGDGEGVMELDAVEEGVWDVDAVFVFDWVAEMVWDGV